MPVALLIPAALLGLLAVAIPVVIHLRRRPRTEIQPFPSLMFLERESIKASQRRRIHRWPLLLLRALAIVLVVLAFARPFFTDESTLAAVGSGPLEHVVLLDRSWSMEAGTRWDDAVTAAREAVADLGPLDRASLVLFDQGGEAVVRSAAEASRIRQALDTLRPGAGATRFGPGLKLAQAIVDDSELPAARVVVISDFQRTGWAGGDGVRFPEGTVVETVSLADGAPTNHAVARVSLNREQVGQRERVTPAARLVRTGGGEAVTVEATLELDGRVAQTRAVELPGEGAAGVVFDPVTLTDAHTRLTVRLPADDLPRDDAWHLVLTPGRALGIHLASAPTRGTSGELYLRRALDVGDEEGFAVAGRGSALPSAAELARSEVVILNDVPFPGGAQGEALRGWVAEGGGLILVAGDRGRWPAAAADLFPGTLGGVLDRESGRGERLAGLDFDHPVFEPFRDPRQGDFTSARFYRARAYQVAAGDSVSILARFDDGTVALAERRVGRGRVLVWSSTLDAFWSDMALKPVFLPFVHRLVRYASGRTPVLESFTAGQVLDVTDGPAMESAGIPQVSAALDSAESRVALTPQGASRELDDDRPFLRLDQDGFFLIRPPGEDQARPVAVAVNVDRSEADPGSFDARELVAAVGGTVSGEGVAGPGNTPAALELRREDQERRQSLWRYLLLGALGLLVTETVVSNWMSRRDTTGGRRAEATG